MSTFNGEKYLKEQLDSILNQELSNWTLYVHDDGSTDDTARILSTYAARDSRIIFAPDIGHLGVKKSFLSLLQYGEGDLYAFSDQDDIWHPDKLQTIADAFSQHENNSPVLIYSDYEEIDGVGKRLPKNSQNTPALTNFSDFLAFNSVTGCTCVINYELRNLLVNNLDRIDMSKLYMHDWWAALVGSAFGKIFYIDKKLVSYRQHQNNTIGAPKALSKIQKIRRVLGLKDRYFLNLAFRQDSLLVDMYRNKLSAQQLKEAKLLANLFAGWNPIHKFIELKANHLIPNNLSFNLQIFVLLWLPIDLRQRALR